MAVREQLQSSVTLASATGNTHVATVAGYLDAERAQGLSSGVARVAKTREATLVVDLCDASFVDAAALRVLTRLARDVRGRGGTVVLASPDPRVAQQLAREGLQTILPVEPSLAKA